MSIKSMKNTFSSPLLSALITIFSTLIPVFGLLFFTPFALFAAPYESPTMELTYDGLGIAVSWTEVSGAEGYNLYYAPYPFTGTDTIGFVDMGESTSFSIELWDGAAFYVGVRAYDSDREGDFSNIDYFILNSPGDDSYKTDGNPAYLSGEWLYLGGPPGGIGYDVRIRPDNSDIMYVTDANAGVFKSLDGGRTWYPSSQGIDARFWGLNDIIPVFSLTIDPHNHDILWAGTQYSSGVFKSVDAGGTWVNMNTGDNGITERELSVRGFTVDPIDPDTVYMAAEVSSWEWNSGGPITTCGFDRTKGVVYKSVDGGNNWKKIWYGDNLARYIWIDPRDNRTLFVSTGIFDRHAANSDCDNLNPGGVGILKSTDGGETWRVLGVENGFDADGGLFLGTLFMDPVNPDVLLAASYVEFDDSHSKKIYRTVDGGENWTTVFSDPSFGGISISSVEICESDNRIAYAAGKGGLLKSYDNGETWQILGRTNWGPSGIIAGFAIDMQCDPKNPDRIFVNNYNGGNFFSGDGGQTWVNASNGYSGGLLLSVAVDPKNPARLFTASRSGFFTTRDGGATWQGLANGDARAQEGQKIVVNPVDSNHLVGYIIDAGFFPLYSFDGGQSWGGASYFTEGSGLWQDGPPEGHNELVLDLIFSPVTGRNLYATIGKADCMVSGQCTGRGIMVSVDGGISWDKTDLTQGLVTGIAINESDESEMYAITYSGEVYYSKDAGVNWSFRGRSPVTTVGPDADMVHPAQVATVLALDPFDSKKLYHGLNPGGVRVSLDGGESWSESSVGLPGEIRVTDIEPDPNRGGLIYLSSFIEGVFYSLDGGGTWTKINNGLSNRTVEEIVLSPDGSVLYAGSGGHGVFRLGNLIRTGEGG
ncbi:MAG: hypothetical protein HQK66_02370 [Desulfamplus sp.]|nr:hypothetical protein [Desulfamplus sp.]